MFGSYPSGCVYTGVVLEVAVHSRRIILSCLLIVQLTFRVAVFVQ